MVVAFPEHGTLEILEGENGKFRYTPHKGYVGEDEFSYVARDEWGNFSTLGKISVDVSERLSEIEFNDMKNRESYNAAVTLSAMGIMEGKRIGDGVYFMPDDSVTKAEFVTMLMKTLGIKAESTVTETFFDDNASIPQGMVSYIGTAQKLGLITGEFKNGKLLFKPNEEISTYEAAMLIRRALGDKAEAEIPANLESDIPVYAREDAYVLCSLGIIDTDFYKISRDDCVTKEACAAYLYKLLQM